MLAIILTIIISFFATSLFGYVVHRSLHQNWSGRFNKAHMTHHLTLYPPNDYSSDKYRDAGKDNTIITFAFASVPLISIPILLFVFNIIPLSLLIVSILIMSIMGFLNNFIHDAFHIRNHFLNKVPLVKIIFRHWNKLHYLHHVDMQKNFGIFVFHWDIVFKTYWKNLYDKR